ncbi:MAG TPA: hypothetical protein VKA38_07230 [Draconibacterium sp.]|nr:hypothetical protein [Draconibacterium sp.]
MKKLVFLLATVIFTAISASVFAQGSGVTPQIGSSHDYWVNASDASTQTSGSGSTYTWWVSNTPSDLLQQMTAGTEFTVLSGTYAGSGGVDNFTIQLKWNPVSAGNTYYLVVKENDGSCDNIKAVAIEPVNAFDITFATIDGSGADADSTARCAPDIAVSASGTTITYNYGSDSYIYKISSAGLYSDWTFNYAFTNTLGNASPTIEYSTDGSSYSSVSSSGTGVSVTPDSGAKTVYFKVTLDNGDTGGTYEEGLSGQKMVLTLSSISDGTNSPAHIYKSNGSTEFTGDVKQIQTVKARPSTSTIGSN